MKWLVVGFLFLLLVVGLAGCGEDLQPRVDELEAQVAQLQAGNTALEEQLAPPPSFLDRLYPPQAPYPVLLAEMFGLGSAMEGIVVDLTAGDFQNLAADFEAFKAQYEKLRDEIIPEWEKLMPLDPVNGLGEALGSQDPAQIGAALGKVGEVCGKCHGQNQVKVQLKYHWPDFGVVELTDPISGDSVSVHDFMQNMALPFDGIGHDLSQGQTEEALQDYQNFASYFDTLNEGCSKCHDPRRDYLLDPAIESDIDSLGQALQAPAPDPEAIAGLSQKIGNAACLNCHLVHLPSVAAKEGWEQLEK